MISRSRWLSRITLTRPREPDFLKKTHTKHFSANGRDSFTIDGENSEEVDIYHLDNVNIDTEMMNLMENNIKYRTIVELKLRKSKITNYAIDEGGK